MIGRRYHLRPRLASQSAGRTSPRRDPPPRSRFGFGVRFCAASVAFLPRTGTPSAVGFGPAPAANWNRVELSSVRPTFRTIADEQCQASPPPRRKASRNARPPDPRPHRWHSPHARPRPPRPLDPPRAHPRLRLALACHALPKARHARPEPLRPTRRLAKPGRFFGGSAPGRFHPRAASRHCKVLRARHPYRSGFRAYFVDFDLHPAGPAGGGDADGEGWGRLEGASYRANSDPGIRGKFRPLTC